MNKYQGVSANIHKLIIGGERNKNKITWLNIINPGKEELEYLIKKERFNFDFQELTASSAKIMAPRPYFEKKNGYLFLILQFPIYKGDEIAAAEIDFFIGHGFLITLHSANIKTVNDFFNTCKKGDSAAELRAYQSSSILLCEILGKLIHHCYKIIDESGIKINEAEKIIFAGRQKEAAAKILELRRNIVNIRKIIQNHKNILKKIMETKSSIVPSGHLKKAYSVLIEHTKRIWEYLENQREMIEAFYDTNESLMNDKINNIMKTLTIFSVIVFPLTLFAAIFGMNTTNGMPLLNHPYGFWIVIGIMGAGTFSMILFFIKKKWL